MAGSHRAPAPPRRSRVPATVLAGVLLAGAVVGGGYLLARPKSNGPAAGPPLTTPTATPTTTPTATPTTTPTPTAKPTTTPKPKPKAKPLPRVRPSAPHRLVVRGLLDVGFDTVVAPKSGVFSAASTTEVARWGGRGVPGSPSADTVFVIGKVSTKGAFAKLPKLYRGVRISMQTRTGVLTYTVQVVTERRAKGLTTDPTFTRRFAGRLQLIGIRYDARGERTGTILVVTAQLTGARAGP